MTTWVIVGEGARNKEETVGQESKLVMGLFKGRKGLAREDV